MSVPEQYTDLERLNAYIGRFVRTHNDKSVVIPGGWEAFQNIENDFGLELERIHTSGNRNDCLIHAFLTSTCPNFRELDDKTKDSFADRYRRNGLQYIAISTDTFQSKTEKEKDDIIRRIESRGFLEDAEVSILCTYYNIKIAVFETLRTYNINKPNKPSFTIYGESFHRNIEDDKVFILYNPGNYHFESIRIANTGEYTFVLSFAQMIQESYIDTSTIGPLTRPPSSVTNSTTRRKTRKPPVNFKSMSDKELEDYIAARTSSKKSGGSRKKRNGKTRKTRRRRA